MFGNQFVMCGCVILKSISEGFGIVSVARGNETTISRREKFIKQHKQLNNYISAGARTA